MNILTGTLLEKSEKLQSLFEQVVGEVDQINSKITGIKPPDKTLEPASQALVDQLGEDRGRPLFLPFVGSGAGRGSYVEVEDGSVKLDLINGIGINILGHSHPVMIKAGLKASIQDVIMQGNLEPNKELCRFMHKLVELGSKNSHLKHAWVTTSGSMANENALKMCRQKTKGAKMIIAMKAAFAGRTSLMAQVTDDPGKRQGLPEYDEVRYISFYDKNNESSIEDSLSELKAHIEAHRGDICAFMFEPMQGEGGFNVAPKEFFVPLFELCKKEGIPIWADEIQTFCRTGEFFAFEALGLSKYIDICTIAKTIQSGATLYSEELNPRPGLIAGTFAGSTASLTAGYDMLTYLSEKGFMGESGKISQVHKKFIQMLNELNESSCKGLLRDAGGMGLMIAVTPLDGSNKQMLNLVKTLYKNGLIAFGCGRGPYRIRFLIPATITDEEIAAAMDAIENSIRELA